VEARKNAKKEQQQAGQKELREKSKKNSDVVKMRKVRVGKSVSNKEPIEILPQRVTSEQRKIAQSTVPTPTPAGSAPKQIERHRLITTENQRLR
jgi:putative transposase